MNALRIGTYIISGYTGMMLTVDCSRLTVHGVNSQPWTVNSELEFTIPMLTDLILGIAYWYQFHRKTGRVETPAVWAVFSLKQTWLKARRLSPYRYRVQSTGFDRSAPYQRNQVFLTLFACNSNAWKAAQFNRGDRSILAPSPKLQRPEPPKTSVQKA